MQERFVEMKIDHLKPQMKTIRSLDEIKIIPNITVAQVKVDGEFNYLRYGKDGKVFTLNRWGRMRTDFPAINQLKEALDQLDITEAEFLVELYAKEGDRPLKLPQFIHYIKSGNQADLEKIHIGVWDIISLNMKKLQENYAWKYQEASMWLKNCTHAQVLPYIIPKHNIDLETFWQIYIETHGYEGLVIRQNSQIYKLKPKGELDAVIIGINKKTSYGKKLKLLENKQVSSLKLALMNQNGDFIEIGDVASGINHDLRKALYQLTDYKIAEDENTIYIKPFVIAQIEYTELFPSQNNKILKLTPQGYIETAKTNLVRLRHPRLIRFRPDKQPTPKDIGIRQIPQKYLLPEEANPLNHNNEGNLHV